jgi:hypothetical protein
MSFQAYLDNIKTKTGKTPDDFRMIAEKKGLLKEGVKAGEVLSWLKTEYELGHGHAMAIYAVLKGKGTKDKGSVSEKITAHFKGKKGVWLPVYDELVKGIREFGEDVRVLPNNTYLNILRGDKKMAIVQVSVTKMDIGIKLKGVKPTKRFEPAEGWNAMVTHRVHIMNARQIDEELMDWLRSAYEQNGE